jgi:hypothetical protein
MSMSLVELAADLSSFNNIEPDVVLQKLQSGLAGMARPLREVGVFISAARVETEAYTSGIAAQGEELTDAQKIQARYNIILQDTTKAQGDFQRTLGESLPNQLRVVRAELEEVAASLGEALLPLVRDLTSALADAIPVIDNFVIALTKVLDLSPGIIQLLGRFGDLQTTTEDLRTGALEKLGPAAEKTAGQMVDLGQAVYANVSPAIHRFAGFLFQTEGALQQVRHATQKTDVKFADLTLTLDTVANSTVKTRGAFMNASETMETRARKLANAMAEIAKEDWVNPKYVAFLSEQGPEWLIGFANLTETQQHKAQQAWRDSTTELDNARDSQEKMIGALDKLDKSETKHKITIEYDYVGFDPTKPGMMAGQTGGAANNQQR